MNNGLPLESAGEEHQNEFVRELNGVRYYNNSASNSPNQTMTTLNAFDQRVILITGGFKENENLDLLGDVLVEKIKHLILIGPTGSLIEMALMRKLVGKHRGINIRITHCNTLKQGVDCASLSGKPGDSVIMSPAGDSSDMLTDYKELGRIFKEYVASL